MRTFGLFSLFGVLAATLSGVGSSGQSLPSTETERIGLPRVVNAPDPSYPMIALAARVSGTVHLQVSTDGKRVASIDREEGPMMLRSSAEESIRTWVFEDHKPTSFTATFEYKMLDAWGCVEAKRGVIRDLPTRVEIDDVPMTCDWDRYNRQQQYLREQHVYPVELHVTVDEKPVANPTEVEIIHGQEVLTLPVRENIFLVPEDLAKERVLIFQAVIGREAVEIGRIDGHALEYGWSLDLPKKVALNAKSRLLGVDSHHSCTLSFEPLDGDGSAMTVTPCRKKLKQ